jgi:hypothetical protein
VTERDKTLLEAFCKLEEALASYGNLYVISKKKYFELRDKILVGGIKNEQC